MPCLLSSQHFIHRTLLKQQELNADVDYPHVDRLSVLLLSKPIREINDTLIMEFFGVYWIVTPLGAPGFFSTLNEALEAADDA